MQEETPQQEVIVSLSDVGVVFANGFAALQGVSLEVNRKDFLGLVGPNGSGKTTMIGAMLGLVRPTTGSVEVFGKPLSPEALRRVGYVPQKAIASDVNFPSTVFETVLMGRVARTSPFRRFGREDREAVERTLEHLGIQELRDRRIGELSGGQSQRVFLAKALVGDPDLMILDEPTSGVDSRSSAEFYETLGHLNKDHGITVVLASHDIGVVTRYSNRVACLNGTVFFHGTTSEFVKSSALSEVYGYPVEVVRHDEHA
ncbi:MAG: metal ABC transporter ATP-binding protein [archaeon]|nr:MAG: metal ABC transporter ATP-binding protein [archaeon]